MRVREGEREEERERDRDRDRETDRQTDRQNFTCVWELLGSVDVKVAVTMQYIFPTPVP